ncbi:HD domain-containing protein [Nocardia araoensis]|uniref:HD domain-containing protein n=1 Tax=Nocardia araoensis TaxID=228600 RepID=UPI0012F6A2B9|nr:HD domain-containing protein [Nocardia araoensis]
MSSNDLRDEVEARLAPWHQQLGADRAAYTNHVLRVLALCDLLADDRQTPPSAREEFLTAAVLHDIGIWSAGSFDYLAPSCDQARAWLASIDRDDLTGLVVAMIDQHHKIRPAAAARPGRDLPARRCDRCRTRLARPVRHLPRNLPRTGRALSEPRLPPQAGVPGRATAAQSPHVTTADAEVVTRGSGVRTGW